MCDDEYVDPCFECMANKKDYGMDEDGHLIRLCDDCWANEGIDWSEE